MTVAPAPAVTRLVPFAHASSVEASIAFYELLGFSPQSVLRDRHGRAFWAMLASGNAELMLAQASGPIDHAQQAVLFYMYANDVIALRSHVLNMGVADGQTFSGQPGPAGVRRVVFNVAHPHHMPVGELRLHDPDGYVILVGQLA